MEPNTLVITDLYGNCPVQGWGTVNGKEFYFRSRGAMWTMAIGWDPVGMAWRSRDGEDEFFRHGSYGKFPEAGWMPHWRAREIIFECAKAYWEELGLVAAPEPFVRGVRGF